MEVHSVFVTLFGILGNIISIGVYLSPLFTFREIYQQKSTMNFQVIPYVLALLSANIWLYYALLTTKAALLLSINAIGCVIESVYISLFLYYARSRQIKRQTIILLLCLNVGVFATILISTLFLVPSSVRGVIVGWICVALSILVSASPLSIAFEVIKTKSVQFMPFPLSFTITISAIIWFIYGVLQTDVLIALPNVIGLVLGIGQMILYVIYKNKKKRNEEEAEEDEELPEVTVVESADQDSQVPQREQTEIDGSEEIVEV